MVDKPVRQRVDHIDSGLVSAVVGFGRQCNAYGAGSGRDDRELADHIVTDSARTPTTLRRKAFGGQSPTMAGAEVAHQIDDAGEELWSQLGDPAEELWSQLGDPAEELWSQLGDPAEAEFCHAENLD